MEHISVSDPVPPVEIDNNLPTSWEELQRELFRKINGSEPGDMHFDDVWYEEISDAQEEERSIERLFPAEYYTKAMVDFLRALQSNGIQTIDGLINNKNRNLK